MERDNKGRIALHEYKNRISLPDFMKNHLKFKEAEGSTKNNPKFESPNGDTYILKLNKKNEWTYGKPDDTYWGNTIIDLILEEHPDKPFDYFRKILDPILTGENYISTDNSNYKPDQIETQEKFNENYQNLEPLINRNYFYKRSINDNTINHPYFRDLIYSLRYTNPANGRTYTNVAYTMINKEGKINALAVRNDKFKGAFGDRKNTMVVSKNPDKSKKPDEIHICETLEDCMSHFQLNQYKLPQKTLKYMATQGAVTGDTDSQQITSGQLEMINIAINRMNPQKINFGLDNDLAGWFYSCKILSQIYPDKNFQKTNQLKLSNIETQIKAIKNKDESKEGIITFYDKSIKNNPLPTENWENTDTWLKKYYTKKSNNEYINEHGETVSKSAVDNHYIKIATNRLESDVNHHLHDDAVLNFRNYNFFGQTDQNKIELRFPSTKENWKKAFNVIKEKRFKHNTLISRESPLTKDYNDDLKASKLKHHKYIITKDNEFLRPNTFIGYLESLTDNQLKQLTGHEGNILSVNFNHSKYFSDRFDIRIYPDNLEKQNSTVYEIDKNQIKNFIVQQGQNLYKQTINQQTNNWENQMIDFCKTFEVEIQSQDGLKEWIDVCKKNPEMQNHPFYSLMVNEYNKTLTNENKQNHNPDKPTQKLSITIDNNHSWKDLKNTPVFSEKGVNTMRTKNKQADYMHFGNPFSEKGYGNTIKMPSVEIACLAYEYWLTNTIHTNPDKTINIYAGTNENPELSNFAHRPFTTITPDNKTERFNNVEAAFQAHKLFYSDITNPHNHLLYNQIKETQNGAEAKKLGKQFKGLDTEKWNTNNYSVMKDLVRKSFRQNRTALYKLLNTKNATLTHNQDNGKWKNAFPQILMELRKELLPKVIEYHKPVKEFKNITNHSGGALGADCMFDYIGKKYGQQNQKHYYTDDIKTPKGNVQITKEQLEEGIAEVKKAAKRLKRNVPKKYLDEKNKAKPVINLVARNWQQVKNATQVNAIASISDDFKNVEGGTGWAVAMAQNHNREINVFNLKDNHWYSFNYKNQAFEKSETPILHKNFAGIGSRQDKGTMTQESIQAIYNIYKKTKQHQPINPKQRNWILTQITDGKLDHATLLYDSKLSQRGKGSHAESLKSVVTQLRQPNKEQSQAQQQNTNKSTDKVKSNEITI